MSDSASSVLNEAATIADVRVVERAADLAGLLGYHRLARWLEASGPLLRLAATSEEASRTVHAYRVARDIMASPESSAVQGIAAEAFLIQTQAMEELLTRPGMSQDLVDAVRLETRRSAVLYKEAPLSAKRVVSGVTLRTTPSEASDALLASWASQMRSMETLKRAPSARAAFDLLIARMPASSNGWNTIVELALDRARRVRRELPDLARGTYFASARARDLIDRAFFTHGKGELFEQFARHDPEIISRIEGELRSAWPRAAARGPEWRPVHSQSELRLIRIGKGGVIGPGLKGPDMSVLVAADLSLAELAKLPIIATGERVRGVAQPTSFFEFKAEKLVSDIPEQQERALPRILEGWDVGDPVFARASFLNSEGKIEEGVWLLQPPDSVAGLRYFGVGTSNSIIAELPSLSKAGADVENLTLQINNTDLGSLWSELFWSAYESLR